MKTMTTVTNEKNEVRTFLNSEVVETPTLNAEGHAAFKIKTQEGVLLSCVCRDRYIASGVFSSENMRVGKRPAMIRGTFAEEDSLTVSTVKTQK